MRNFFKKIALSLSLFLITSSIPTFAITIDTTIDTSTDVIIFDEIIELTPEEYQQLKEMSLEQNGKSRSFSTDHTTYIQYAVSKSNAINIKNTYNKLTNALTYGGLGIWGGEKVASISKLSKYSNARTFIRAAGNWGSNIINVLTFASVLSIIRFTSQIQSSLDQMNNTDKLLFRVESHDLMDAISCRYIIKIQRS